MSIGQVVVQPGRKAPGVNDCVSQAGGREGVAAESSRIFYCYWKQFICPHNGQVFDFPYKRCHPSLYAKIRHIMYTVSASTWIFDFSSLRLFNQVSQSLNLPLALACCQLTELPFPNTQRPSPSNGLWDKSKNPYTIEKRHNCQLGSCWGPGTTKPSACVSWAPTVASLGIM